MWREFLIFSGALLLGTLGGSVPKAFADDQEPLYRGKPIGAWSKALKDLDMAYRLEAAQALVAFAAREQATEAMDPLIEALAENQDVAVRRLAARALGLIGAQKVLRPLRKATNDQDKDVAREARAALAEASQKALPELLAALQQLREKLGNQNDVVSDLGAIGEPAVAPLIKALDHKDSSVRYYAARALGLMGTEAKDAVPAIRVLLKDSDGDVRRAAANTLNSIDPKPAQRAPSP